MNLDLLFICFFFLLNLLFFPCSAKKMHIIVLSYFFLFKKSFLFFVCVNIVFDWNWIICWGLCAFHNLLYYKQIAWCRHIKEKHTSFNFKFLFIIIITFFVPIFINYVTTYNKSTIILIFVCIFVLCVYGLLRHVALHGNDNVSRVFLQSIFFSFLNLFCLWFQFKYFILFY